MIAAVVIGGTRLFGGEGSVVGALVGSLIMGMLTNGLILCGPLLVRADDRAGRPAAARDLAHAARAEGGPRGGDAASSGSSTCARSSAPSSRSRT